eukprot:m.18274 g.18274  ORF g.18274 m.18274 type:complete len:497 (-) comp6262_c0_seq1:63-1553(-)
MGEEETKQESKGGWFGSAPAIKKEPTTQAPSSRQNSTPYIGERVLLRGTGTRWLGGCFRATVVDFRESDNTVKVQYDDGGYKRFAYDEFRTVMAGGGEDDHLEFGTHDFEWADDQFNPVMHVESDLQALRNQMAQAVRRREFMKAHELKEKIADLSEDMYEMNIEEGKLLSAVRNQDFLLADEINKKIMAMHTERQQKKKSGPVIEEDFDAQSVLQEAAHKALRGGVAGATAMVIQVSSLMWMRTTMNYQYRHGMGTMEALRTLYKEGGVRRFYRGITPALLQGPLSRFGDTAANAGVLALFKSSSATRDLPIAVQTLGASVGAASFRIFLMPLDTMKTMMQVEGKDGLKKLMAKARTNGPTVFYHGAIGASAATFAGHYPWFATYNTLDSVIPVPEETLPKLARNAFLGFSASAVSDTTSNSLRVLKTFRQTSEIKISYVDAARHIIDKDGMSGLFGRGLKTRLMANGTQGLLFSVLWKYFDGLFAKSTAKGSSY